MSEGENKSYNFSVVPKSVEKVMENVLDQPSKSIGETFNDLWYLVLGGPVGHLAEKRKLKYAKSLELFKKQIEKKIKEIPKSRRIEPDLQITGAFLDASKYCVEREDLREMFAKIIAASMDSAYKNYVSPLYVDILSKMSINAARLFKDIDNFRIVTYNDIPRQELYFALEELMQFRLIVGKGDYQVNHCSIIPKKIGLTFYHEEDKIVSVPAQELIPDTVGARDTYLLTSLGAKLLELCFGSIYVIGSTKL